MPARRSKLKIITIILSSAFIGAVLAITVVFILYVNNKPELSLWHATVLENEFTVDSDVKTLDNYRILETRLFKELKQKVNDLIPIPQHSISNRYTPGSLSNPDRWSQNWNRTFEWEKKEAVAGVLMLHGLSDSPYSLRQLAWELHDAGAWVLGLRLPGHGTVPTGLINVSWQDMAAAVRLAMLHLKQHLGERPLYIIGYSNGAALAIEYTLCSLNQDDLPRPDRLVLLSPAIAITPLAKFAVWQAKMGELLGLDKLKWQDILPEYDPYKYQSFATNSGNLGYQLTAEVKRLLKRHSANNKLNNFPPTLTFISAVDATVSTHAVVNDFFHRLKPNHHELIAFDLNRQEGIDYLFNIDPKDDIQTLLHDKTLPFRFGVISNKNPDSAYVVLRMNNPASPGITETALGLKWPVNTYSLSHVALPFPPNDPLYGGSDAKTSPGVTIGNTALRGEKGALNIPARDMLRQRWNPFYTFIKNRSDNFLINNR